MLKKSVRKRLEWLENVFCRNGTIARQNIKNNKVPLQGPEGSIQGPWLVLDPMEVSTCVPKVPWYAFCCLG